MTTDAFAIKPCPFCGGEATIDRKGTHRASMQVSCTQCNTHMESGDVFGLTPPENWQWNRRVPVTVSEAGEAEGLLMKCKQYIHWSAFGECRIGDGAIETPAELVSSIDAYLSRKKEKP